MPRMCMGVRYRLGNHPGCAASVASRLFITCAATPPNLGGELGNVNSASIKLSLGAFAVGGIAVLIRVVIVVVVAFAPEVDIVEDDAEHSGADGRKFVTGAL